MGETGCSSPFCFPGRVPVWHAATVRWAGLADPIFDVLSTLNPILQIGALFLPGPVPSRLHATAPHAKALAPHACLYLSFFVFFFLEKHVIPPTALHCTAHPRPINLGEQTREGGVAWGEHGTRLGSRTNGRIHPRNSERPKQHPQESQGDGNTKWAVKAERFGPVTPPDIQPPATPAPLPAPHVCRETKTKTLYSLPLYLRSNIEQNLR